MRNTLFLILSLVAASTAYGQSVYVDIGRSNQCFGTNLVPPCTFGAAAPAGCWNAVLPQNPAPPNLFSFPLNSVAGQPTLVTVTPSLYWSSLVGCFNNNLTPAPDHDLLDDFYNVTEQLTWTFDNLAPGTYEVFTYAWDGQTPGVLTTVDVPQSAAGPIQVGGAVWTVAGGYVSGSHFSQHQVVLGTGQSTIDVVCTPPAFPDFPDGGRLNGIQLVFTPPSPPGPTGLTFCSSLPNSAGQTAAIGATATVLPSGSIDAFANDLTVFATDMPANQPGIFFFGTSAIDFPFGNGIRCVGGQVLRIWPPSTSTAGGGLVRSIDYSILEAEYGPSFGSLNVQCWFRDQPGGGIGFNLSDGLQLSY